MSDSIRRYEESWKQSLAQLRLKAADLGVTVKSADLQHGRIVLSAGPGTNESWSFEDIRSAWCWVSGALWAKQPVKKAA